MKRIVQLINMPNTPVLHFSRKVCTLFFIFLSSFAFSQDVEEEIEFLFASRSIYNLEQELNVPDDMHQAALDIIDQEYQVFFSAVKTRLQQGETIDMISFNAEWAQLVSELDIEIAPYRSMKKLPSPYPDKVLNGPCVNMDFEEGTLNGWTLTRGNVPGTAPYSFNAPVGVGPGAYHQVFTNGTDPIVPIPRVSPFGGGVSVRLGNGTGTGSQGARMTQSFLVTPTNYLFTYDYAVVFQSPTGHTNNQQPYFTVRVFNQSGGSIPCGEYSVIATPATAPGYSSVVSGGETILYKTWSQVITNLVSFIGQNVTVEFTSGDCSLSGHYGYAYVDASCGIDEITATDTIICAGTTATLTAPGGVQNYIWSTGETTQSINVSTAGTYTCTLVPFQGMGCSIVLTKTVTVIPATTISAAPATSYLCFGDPFVTLTSTAAGGTAPYTYSWSSGQSTPSINATAGGTYTVTLTDAGNCPPVQASVVVNQFTQPIVANAGPDVTVCAGTSSNIAINGSVTGVTTGIWSGGTGTYTTNVNDLSLNYTLSPAEIAAGTTTLTLTTTNNGTCPPSSDNVTINVSEMTLTVSSQQNLSCFGGSNGSVILNGTGGLLPYTYSLNGGTSQPSNAFTNLPAGTHNAVVTDAAGCSGNVSFTITAPPQLTFTQVAQNVDCFGTCTGEITVTANGGTLPYTYSSNFGTTFYPSNVLTNLCAGTVGVVVQDANGCITNVNVPITQPTQLTANYVNVDPICAGVCDGSITVTASGGTASYQYSVNGGALQPSGSLTGLCDGSHTVLVQDAQGCEITSVQVLVDPPTFGIDLVSMTESNCGFNNGSIEVVANGLNGPFTYSMDGGAPQLTGAYTNLVAGAYSFVATDALGCTAQTFEGINDIEMDGILLVQTDALCFGGNEGTVEVINVLGAAPITYELDNSTITQTNGTFTGLSAGSHIVTIYDAGLCIFTIPFVTGQPDEIQFVGAVTDVTCNTGTDGAINITSTTGGTGAYQYSIDGINFQAGTSFTGLAAGTYYIYVIDANNCSVVQEFIIDEPTPVTLQNNLIHLTCFNNSTGVIQLDGFGGEGGYQYSINNGTTFQPSQTFFGLSAGNYIAVVSDLAGCEATANIVLTEPAPLVGNYLTTPVVCFGDCNGIIQVTANGGTAPYLYSSNNGVTMVTSPTLSGLCAGSYQVQVIDDNGCGVLSNVNITTPTELTITTNVVPSTCGLPNGEISGAAAGGIPLYTYSLDNVTYGPASTFTGLTPGLYTIYVRDDNDCEAQSSGVIDNLTSPVITGSSFADVTCEELCDGEIQLFSIGGTGVIQYSIGGAFQLSNVFPNLCPGTYTTSVMDDNNCVTNGPAPIVITEPDTLIFTTNVANVLCNGIAIGSIEINATGGTPIYGYSFDGGGIFQPSNVQNLLPAGVYNLAVFDQNNCSATAQVTITEPPLLSIVDIVTVDATCFSGCDGTATSTIIGGTIATDYQQYWDTLGVPTNTSSVGGLCLGSYVLSVVDDNGCFDTMTFVINEPLPFVIDSVDFVNPLCNVSCDGEITVYSPNATGYSFDGGNTFVPTNSVNTFCEGTYDIVVQNNVGCTDTLLSVVLVDPPVLTVAAGQDSIICDGTTAVIHATPAGGTAPYQYTWDTGDNTSSVTVSPLVNTTYNVFIEDANGCTTANETTIISIYPLLTTVEVNDTTVCPGSNVLLGVQPQTGVPGFTYSWSTGGSTIGATQNTSVSPMNTTTYVVNTTDFCTTVTDTVVVTVFNVPEVTLNAVETEGCAPFNAVLYPSMTGTNCTWTFSNGLVVNGCDTITATFTIPGCYDATFTGLTTDGCAFTSFGQQVVCVIADPIADFTYYPSKPNFLNPEVLFTNQSTAAENWHWTFSPGFGGSTDYSPSVNFQSTSVGDIINACLYVSNYLGCADTLCKPILIEDAFALYVPNSFTPDGDSYNGVFRPVFPPGYNIQNFQMLIFNRWGELIYESEDPTEGWNGYYKGALMQSGTYTWKIQAMDGITRESVQLTGHCNLLK